MRAKKITLLLKGVLSLIIILTLAGCADSGPAQSVPQSDNNSPAVSSGIESSPSPQPAQDSEETQIPSPAITEKNDESPIPVLYETDGQVYLACGSKAVCLGKLTLIETDGEYGNNLNGMITADNKIIYYLSNVNEQTGAGDLMRIDIRDSLTPVLISKGVCDAVASEDGERVIYLKNEANGMGDLFLKVIGSNEEEISDNVIVGYPEFTGGGYGFSKNGDYIYFIKQNGSGESVTYSLYTKGEGQEKNFVTATTPESGDTFSRLLIANNGDMVFSMWVNDETDLYYYLNKTDYPSTKLQLLSTNSIDDFIVGSFEDINDFLYLDDHTLLYKDTEHESTFLSDNFDSVRFNNKNGFILAEKSDDENYVELYEADTIGIETYLMEADGWYIINNDTTCVAFTFNGKLFIMQKTDNVWGPRQLVCEGTPRESFDPAGKYLYYFENAYEMNPEDDWDSGWCGDLYRYRLSDGKKELLLKNAVSYCLIDNEVYGITDKGAAYRIDCSDQKEKISDNALDVWGDSNGIYVSTETKDYKYSISFLTKEGENSIICSNADQILSFNGYIESALPY